MGIPSSVKCISADIQTLQLVPKIKWTDGIDATWTPGEDAAIELVKNLSMKNIAAYKIKRDFPSLPGTSRISPYLAVGALSVRSV
ncbi:hypothetical protein JQK62_24820, partial [Leptospira santarosai]|nr:hypothetical protein [Leptospira santarosai]